MIRKSKIQKRNFSTLFRNLKEIHFQQQSQSNRGELQPPSPLEKKSKKKHVPSQLVVASSTTAGRYRIPGGTRSFYYSVKAKNLPLDIPSTRPFPSASPLFATLRPTTYPPPPFPILNDPLLTGFKAFLNPSPPVQPSSLCARPAF